MGDLPSFYTASLLSSWGSLEHQRLYVSFTSSGCQSLMLLHLTPSKRASWYHEYKMDISIPEINAGFLMNFLSFGEGLIGLQLAICNFQSWLQFFFFFLEKLRVLPVEYFSRIFQEKQEKELEQQKYYGLYCLWKLICYFFLWPWHCPRPLVQISGWKTFNIPSQILLVVHVPPFWLPLGLFVVFKNKEEKLIGFIYRHWMVGSKMQFTVTVSSVFN